MRTPGPGAAGVTVALPPDGGRPVGSGAVSAAGSAPLPASVAVLAGGVGAARMLSALCGVTDPASLTAIANVGDDLELHGLHISPDLDTITYTLAGEINAETGWGLTGETWQAMDTVRRYGGIDWFGLGDRDLGTHLFRTQRLAEGASLTEVTGEITRAWGLGVRLLPVTDDRLRTMITLAEGPDAGQEVSFQEYFVHRRHDVAVQAVRFDGADAAQPGLAVLPTLGQADRIVIAPSNPVVSIDPVLAVPGVRAAIEARRADTIAVSPIVAGAALKGPADRLLRELGHDDSVVGVARLYAPLAATLVIDEADADLADAVAAEGIRPVVTRTIMREPGVGDSLARTVLTA
jgi:LPPG:FO 2-phospho-L-lactate transferase